ncbi:MAG: molybdenum cofactor biosysynthesis protein, partial [Verrucomicrobiota bacterium]
MKIHHLYISPGHNYFGHYGKPAGTHQIIEHDEIECVAGKGVMGDRFFDYKEDYKGQITFFSMDVFEALCQKLGVKGAAPSATRRNVVISGVDLNSLIGKEFELQGVHFEGSCECSPCFWMDEAIAPGA